MTAATLPKQERMVSRKLIETLFSGTGSHSMVAYPLRVVYSLRQRGDGQAPAQVLVSVSKRHFKHAVDRNRVKRQIREAYRHQKQRLYDTLPSDQQLLLAIIWLSDEHRSTEEISRRMENLMLRLADVWTARRGE